MTISPKSGAIIIEGHIQGLSNTRSLGEAGVPVYVVDKYNCIAQHSKYCKKFFRSPDYIKDVFVDFLIELSEKERLRDWILIPSNDHAVYTISKNRDKLRDYFKVTTPDLEIIDNIYDKVRLIEIARRLEIPVPLTQTFTSINDPITKELQLPVITKGRNGLSFYKALGQKVLVAKNEIELRKQLQRIQECYNISKTFTQELIPFSGSNKTISFTAFCEHGEIKAHWTGVKLREHPIRFGTATIAKNTYNEICHKQSENLIKTLNYSGVCEIEYIQDLRNGEYKLIEVNPRTWLWVGLAKASGVDYANIIYKHANNQIKDFPIANSSTQYWINPLTDTVYSLGGLLLGKLNLINYLGTILKRRKVHAYFSMKDLKPGLYYIFHVMSFLKNR